MFTEANSQKYYDENVLKVYGVREVIMQREWLLSVSLYITGRLLLIHLHGGGILLLHLVKVISFSALQCTVIFKIIIGTYNLNFNL